MQYRSEIDGLRAVAIIPVVAFHAGISALSGGFVGVDVFFVISGYLITSIILEDIERGRFSLLRFYRRRVLRIVPVLTVVLAATAVAGIFLLFPHEFEHLGKSLGAAALFASNIFLWRSAGYFAPDSAFEPLLHTWSLAVEEQFYLFFPLIIMGIHRFGGRRYGLWVLVAVLVSFAGSVAAVYLKPVAAFYLLPTRAWELGFGSLIAIGWIPKIDDRRLRECLSALGIGLISLSAVMLDEQSTFPGWNAIYPVLGAALFIAYGGNSLTGRALSFGPVLYIGLISYALYLWHWPIIVFYKIRFGAEMNGWDTAIVIAASLALAAASRPLIEQPFRKGLKQVSSARIVSWGGVSLVALASLGAVMLVAGGRIIEVPSNVAKLASYADYPETDRYRHQFRPAECFIHSQAKFRDYDAKACFHLSDEQPNYVLIGDSHGAHIWRGISDAMPEWNVLQATASGCKPLLDGNGATRCTRLMKWVFNDQLPKHPVEGVILAARWQEEDLQYLSSTIDYLRKFARRIILIGPVPEYRDALPLILARSERFGDASLAERELITSRFDLDAELRRSAAAYGVEYLSPSSVLCPDRACRHVLDGGVPVSFDYGHLTYAGAEFLGHAYRSKLIADTPGEGP